MRHTKRHGIWPDVPCLVLYTWCDVGRAPSVSASAASSPSRAVLQSRCGAGWAGGGPGWLRLGGVLVVRAAIQRWVALAVFLAEPAVDPALGVAIEQVDQRL